VDADPLAFELQFYLGWTYLALDRALDAQETLRRALFLEPSFALARYTFALALHRSGETERAIDEYARTARTRTEPQLVERLRQRAGARGESLWVDDSFVAELCRTNAERARRGEPPLGTTLPATESAPRR
jgi:tetratricopeptide (TPR) repeat protein